MPLGTQKLPGTPPPAIIAILMYPPPFNLQALKLNQALKGEEHVENHYFCVALAKAYSVQHDFDKAEECLHSAWAVKEHHLGLLYVSMHFQPILRCRFPQQLFFHLDPFLDGMCPILSCFVASSIIFEALSTTTLLLAHPTRKVCSMGVA